VGIVVVIAPSAGGWVVRVWEGAYVLYEQAGYQSSVAAYDAAQVWVAVHRAGVPCLIDVRSVTGDHAGVLL
jgi:hypothetical protein